MLGVMIEHMVDRHGASKECIEVMWAMMRIKRIKSGTRRC